MQGGILPLSQRANSDCVADSACSNFSCCLSGCKANIFLFNKGELCRTIFAISNVLLALCALTSGDIVLARKDISDISPFVKLLSNSFDSCNGVYKSLKENLLAAMWCSKIKHSYPVSVCHSMSEVISDIFSATSLSVCSLLFNVFAINKRTDPVFASLLGRCSLPSDSFRTALANSTIRAALRWFMTFCGKAHSFGTTPSNCSLPSV